MTQKHLDCLLISPSIFHSQKDNIWSKINSNFPPLGLASIAGFVRAHSFSVEIIDCTIAAPAVTQFENMFIDRIVNRISGISIIGITAFTFNIAKATKIAALCKKYFPQARIICGGPHATAMPHDVIKNDAIDIVSVGEGEYTFLDLLHNKPLNTVPGIVYTENSVVCETKERNRITNLDELPMPAYDLLPILKYKPAKGSYKRLPAMSMVTSRGCPGECTFCFKTLGSRLVFKSAETIYNEISYLVTTYGIKQILFYDDTFTVYKKNVLRLCDLLISNNIDITWTCFARVDYVDRDMLTHMRDAGCHQIMYGVENINETVLKNIKKHINKDQVIQAVRWTKAADIECRLAFMVGNPGDTDEIINDNIVFLKEADPDLAIINITTPLPGTEMFKWADKNGLILSYNWDDYTLAIPVMRLKNLSVEDIQGLYKKMYRSFYFRPKFIVKRLLSIRSFADVRRYASGFKALLSFFHKP